MTDVFVLYPENCVLCQQPIPQHRKGSDYCSATCWGNHHGEMPGEYDADDAREPEDDDE